MNKPTGTREWSSFSLNIQKGCENNCLYCYARFDALNKYKTIKNSNEWKCPVINKEKIKKIILNEYPKKNGIIMFPTVHDITDKNIVDSLLILKRVLSGGNKVLIVSKPHLSCIKSLCNKLVDYKEQILFRFTIGSICSNVLKFWEPGAPSFSERMDSLLYAFDNRYKTSISCEPLLDDPIPIIDNVSKLVTDAIWLGGMNWIEKRVNTMKFSKEDFKYIEKVKDVKSPDKVKEYYNKYKDDLKIKWKDSFKQILGIKFPEELGMDI